MKTTDTTALAQLNGYRSRLTPQQYKTLRGQIIAGDAEGAARGLEKIMEKRRAQAYDHTTRQGARRRPR